MNAVEQITADLEAIKAANAKTAAEIAEAKNALVTLQATITDLQDQLVSGGVITQSLLDLAASARQLAQEVDALLPDLAAAG